MYPVYECRFDSPVGPLWIAGSERGIQSLGFGPLPRPGLQNLGGRAKELASLCREQLREYFAGRLREFTVPLDLARGTPFQRQCWQALQRIPYGETRSYLELAREVERPHAFRAVGQANHHNPIAIIIPCHRVITSDGKLGGYGGGLHTKKFLLELEGASPELRSLQQSLMIGSV